MLPASSGPFGSILYRVIRACLSPVDAATMVDPGGIGVATSTLSDQQGTIGKALQTLLVAAR